MKIEQTKTTPLIDFDIQKQCFCVSGNSTPIDALTFYKSISTWLEENISRIQRNSTFHFYVPYFNSASNKGIFILLRKIKDISDLIGGLKIEWAILDEDEFMKESGEAYEELLDIKLDYIEVKTA